MVDNWEDLLNDDADFDKIIQLKEDAFGDEGVEPDQQAVQRVGQTGPAQPSEKKIQQNQQKKRMQEKLETTKKKYEESAFGNILLPQDKRNLKMQQILLSKKQDEMNIASLVGEEEKKLEIPIIELTLSTKENITMFLEAIQQKLQIVPMELQQAIVIKGFEEAIKELNWTSKETGKMFEKVKTLLVLKEKKERSNKKDKKKQGQVNLSKAATKKVTVDDEDEPSEEEVYEEVAESDEEEKINKKETEEQLNAFIDKVKEVKMENQEQVQGFIVRIIQIMKLIQDEKNKKDWSMDILSKISEIACEISNSKDWKSNVLEKVKEMHNAKMTGEKGSANKNKNPLLMSVNVGKATENQVIMAEKEEEAEQQFDPDEDFM